MVFLSTRIIRNILKLKGDRSCFYEQRIFVLVFLLMRMYIFFSWHAGILTDALASLLKSLYPSCILYDESVSFVYPCWWICIPRVSLLMSLCPSCIPVEESVSFVYPCWSVCILVDGPVAKLKNLYNVLDNESVFIVIEK
jgi:hypothetical protein